MIFPIPVSRFSIVTFGSLFRVLSSVTDDYKKEKCKI
jgi:hypothetical protein